MRTSIHVVLVRALARPFVLALAVSSAACGADDKQPILPPPPPIAPTVSATTPPIDTSTPPVPPPAKPSMAEMQVQTTKALADALNAHDAKKYAASYATDASMTVYGVGEVSGREAVASETQKWIDGFGDLKFQVGRIIQRGDMAVVEWSWAGTHTGEFMTMKPTQRPLGVQGASVLWFSASGLVAKEHRYFDLATLLAQDDPKAKKDSFRAPPALPSNVETHVSKGGADEDKIVDVVKSFYASLETKKEADFLAFVADDTMLDDASQPKPLKGKKDLRAYFASFTKAFTDSKRTSSTLFGADDFVVAEGVLEGVHAASKKPMKLHFVDVLEIKDGKTVAKGWSYSSNKEMNDQLHPPTATAAQKPAGAKR